MQIHELKTWPVYFTAIDTGFKKFEIRKNDRNFKDGDLLILREYSFELKEYTERVMAVKVIYFIQGDFGLPEDICVMGIKRI